MTKPFASEMAEEVDSATIQTFPQSLVEAKGVSRLGQLRRQISLDAEAFCRCKLG